MGSSVSASNKSDRRSEEEDPWWPIENESFTLDQPNLNDLRHLLVENSNRNIIVESDNSIDNRLNLAEDRLNSDSVSEDHRESSVEVEPRNNDPVLDEPRRRSSQKEQTLEEFKEELRIKRMARQGAIADLHGEIASLRKQLEEEREINRRLRGETDNKELLASDGESSSHDQIENANLAQKTVALANESVSEERSGEDECIKDFAVATSGDGEDTIRPSGTTKLHSELSETQLSLQLANAENLSLTTEVGCLKKQVASLKEVIVCNKQMIEIREQQVNQLRTKLRDIEESLAERELRLLSDNLRQEYDKQLANIRNLRQLYEERARVSAAERENLLRQLSIKTDELAAETEKCKNLEERVLNLETELKTAHENISSCRIENSDYSSENKGLKEEMAVINQLFSQMLIGFNGANNLDIDSLTTMLEENRALLNEMTTKEMNSEGASLPKLLFDIVKQANNNKDNNQDSREDAEGASRAVDVENRKDNTNPIRVPSAQEIIGNLPKVWRVLIELLNHHKIERVDIKENGMGEDCYKSVQTPSGPKAELSVSKTYIKLKDLILEKKSLQKETHKLKTLNTHLEQRLHEQENRLGAVTLELTKTWHLVSKMQRQHRQLHTHEQILRYQLHQKRRLLNELKDELEYCRRKWAAARAKNDSSQLICNDLRREFAKRKLEDAHNSAESGYSEGTASEDDDDSEPLAKPVVVSSKTRELFETPRKIERVKSESPQRHNDLNENPTLRRVNSAPPIAHFITDLFQTTVNISPVENFESIAATSVVSEDAAAMATAMVARPPDRVAHASSSGTIPKQGVRLSRSKKREKYVKPRNEKTESLEEMYLRLSSIGAESTASQAEQEEQERHTEARIQHLEDNCTSLMEEVVETANCRDELDSQLAQFQNEIVANQVEEGACANSPATGKSCLTAREEEYTAKRAERLKRLEEESKLLMSRIKRTTERGEGMKSLLDHIHSRCVSSREGSVDSCGPTELTDDAAKESSSGDEVSDIKLTPEEEEYTRRRDERLKKLEEEGKELIAKLSNSTNRGNRMLGQLDLLHNRYSREGSLDSESAPKIANQESGEQREPSVRLTPEEEEYTCRRGESLERLEEEGKSGSSSTDCGKGVLKQLEGNEDINKTDGEKTEREIELSNTRLTPEEEEYTRRRNERLSRLEEESKILIAKLSSSADRGTRVCSQLDKLHTRYGSAEGAELEAKTEERASPSETMEGVPSGTIPDPCPDDDEGATGGASCTTTVANELGEDGKSTDPTEDTENSSK